MASITVVEQPLVLATLQGQVAAATESVGKSAEQACYEFAKSLFPDAECIKPVEYQGGCSYSMLVQLHDPGSRAVDGEDRAVSKIVQFRDARFDFDITMVRKASSWYGSLVPTILARGLAVILGENKSVYEMNLIPGSRLSELLPRVSKLEKPQIE